MDADMMYLEEGFLEHMDYEYDMDQFDYDSLLMDSDISESDFLNLVNFCIKPVIYQSFKSLLPILISSLLIKLVSIKTNITFKQLNLLNLMASSALFAYLYEAKLLIFLAGIVASTFATLTIVLSRIKRRMAVVLLSLLHLFVGKIFLLNVQEWNSIKGIEMVLIMKAISFATDDIQLEVFSYLSYMVSISTTFFGPWIKYDEHLRSLNSKQTFFKHFLKPLTISTICLVCSSCLLSLLEFTYEISFIFQMYFQALSFRLSNYFVCYFSQAVCDLNGVGAYKKSGPNDKPAYSTNAIVRPLLIELPRSLIDVVTSWNLPMHHWLKDYVFKPVKLTYGTRLALFLTYFASVMIHGFDPNIALILFSLGFYTYVEYGLRRRLGRLLGCCVEARECKQKCEHRMKSKHWMTISVNCLFFFLAVFHLAYLGQIFFNNNSEDQTWHEIAWSMWSRTYFSSLAISVVSLFISFLLGN